MVCGESRVSPGDLPTPPTHQSPLSQSPISQSTSQPVNQSTSQPINQSTNHPHPIFNLQSSTVPPPPRPADSR
ncbi:MAG: hypothetical protein D6790_02165 [Caldilineae bacterium]|nr:MAG: hypothetical protein D6790_02165 [Caldilineae bacterium]